jgi:hypothetical protein
MMCDDAGIHLLITPLPSGVRDFLLGRRQENRDFHLIHPAEILALDRTAELVLKITKSEPPLGFFLALCRLLVPCLRRRGSGRHFVIEQGSVADLRGDSLTAEIRTDLARDQASEQLREYEAIRTKRAEPKGSLAELFWRSQTDLPVLQDRCDDSEMGRLAKALYAYLIPDGDGLVRVDADRVAAQVEECRKSGFKILKLGTSPRRLHQAFRRLLALVVRYTSQVTGEVAEKLIGQRLRSSDRHPPNSAEKELIAFRYGASRVLNDINLGFVYGCGPALADLLNEYFLHIAELRPQEERLKIEQFLREELFLQNRLQERRKQTRADERRQSRDRHADRMPKGPRQQAEFQEDKSEPQPFDNIVHHEQLEQFETLLPEMKPRDRKRLRALIDCGGDGKAAAAQLGLDPKVYSRQLRQTVYPAARRLAKEKGFNPFESEDNYGD